MKLLAAGIVLALIAIIWLFIIAFKAFIGSSPPSQNNPEKKGTDT